MNATVDHSRIADPAGLADAWNGLRSQWPLTRLVAAEEQRALAAAMAERSPEWARIAGAVRDALEHGAAALIRSFPVDSDELVVALGSVAGPVSPQPGREGPTLTFEVAARADGRSISESHREFALHTDSAAARSPHGHVGLACCRPDPASGGISLLLDATAVADEVERAHGPETLERLGRPSFPIRSPGIPDAPAHRIALLARNGERARIRYRAEALDAGLEAEGIGARDRAALDALHETIGSLDPATLRLEAGDVLLWENHRLLHGRTAFPPDSPRRLKRLKISSA